jgi:OHCU decarboxylase
VDLPQGGYRKTLAQAPSVLQRCNQMTGKVAREREFNSMDRDAFLEAFADVYEHSSWVAEQSFDHLPFIKSCKFETLTPLMASIVDGASDEVKLALLRAHPDLAGRLALRGELTQESRNEQTAAGLDQCTPEELEKFQRLNGAYKKKFGFPFIVTVSGMARQQILASFEKRVGNSIETEFATALREVHKIAGIRLAKIFGGQK